MRIGNYVLPIIVLFLCSCQKTYTLSIDDLSLNPYKPHSTLVFKSSLGAFDTVSIVDVRTFKVEADPLAAFPDYNEILEVVARHKSPIEISMNDDYSESVFFAITAVKGGNTMVHFGLRTKEAWFYQAHGYRKSEIDKLPNEHLNSALGSLTDVIKIVPSSFEYSSRNEFVSAIYWSKRLGVVKYVLENGISWQLVTISL